MVILDGSRRLRSMPGMIQILQQGPTVGIRSICLDGEDRFLPGECQAVVVVEPEGPARAAGRQDMLRGVRPDAVSPVWCQRLVRGLAAVRIVADHGRGRGIPNSARLLDVLGLEPPTSQAIAARWTMGGETTMAMLGESFDGPFGIDIRRDGPHGLIAGTTGAGKSELLQTIVASLAVANKPTAMTFVLVDYKGGSAFKDCVQLPHTVGMVTDLDNHLVERALESLGAELKRREHILAEAGAKDIEDYGDIRKKNTHLAPMPRLLIVIDEFASMVRELPDFVTGLVNIAQRGRSLGIHLLLATQRPSGVVSPEIRANTNLRIALRVTDGNESTDVIDDPSAGFISKSTPGRAYVRLGANSLVPFQAGRVGGRRPGANVVSRPRCGAPGWTGRGWPSAPPQKPEGAQGRGRRGDHRPEGAGRRDPRGERRDADPAAALAVAAGAAGHGAAVRRAPGAPARRPRPGAGAVGHRRPAVAAGAARGGAGLRLPGTHAHRRRAPLGPLAAAAHDGRRDRAHPVHGRRPHLRHRLRLRRPAPADRRCRTAARWCSGSSPSGPPG